MGIDYTVFKGSASGDIVETKGHREIGPTEVSVKISHCGVCGTDEHFRHAEKGLGHESVGVITALGSAVESMSNFKVGDRVGMGYYNKFCGHCRACVTGRQAGCENQQSFSNSNGDQGGFGTGLTWDVSALYKLPDQLASEHAGPLMCGGATVWAPLFEHGIQAGDRVGVIGIGGLGHLAIQFASKMGMEVVAFSSTDAKKQDALAFGASEFHATKGLTQFEGVKKLDALLITASAAPADLAKYFPILAKGAYVFPLTVSPEILPFSSLSLIGGNLKVIGSNVGGNFATQSMLEFAAKHGIAPQIEKFPMSTTGITNAMQKLRDGKVRYRGVLVVQ